MDKAPAGPPVAGVIGLGSMGMGAAQSTLRAGLETWGCDLRPKAVQSLREAGGHGARDLAELGARADVLLVYVVEVHRVIQSCAGNSWMFANRGAHVVAGDYTPRSAVDIFVKDLGIVIDTARAAGMPTPMSETAQALFRQASSEGMGRLDDAAVALLLARQGGSPLPGDPATGAT